MERLRRINRRNFLRWAGLGLAGLITAGCQRPKPQEAAIPTKTPTPEPTATRTPKPTPTRTPKPEATATPTPTPTRVERLIDLNSQLLVPPEVARGGREAVDLYLTDLISQDSSADKSFSLPYINRPGMLPDNDKEPALLTGKKEPGQSQAALALQVTNAEVRVISGGQFVLPLTEEAAAKLLPIKSLRESIRWGTINNHLVYEQVTLADGRPGLLIPGGRDEDKNVYTPEDNYNRGNVLIVLASERQASTALYIQVDTNANWQAQYNLGEIIATEGGIKADELLPYLLYSPDAQRSEEHGMSTMESMFRGPNCQGSGCRTKDDNENPLAAMAGVGVYIVQINPSGEAVDVLGATVVPDSSLREIYP